MSHFRRLIAVGAATASDRVQYAHCLKEAGDIATPLEAGQATAEFPFDIDALRACGLSLLRRGRDAEAINVLLRALALDPGNVDMQNDLSALGIEGDRLDSHFIPALLAGATANPAAPGVLRRLVARWHLRRARGYARGRHWGKAAQCYSLLLAADPQRQAYLVQLGHILREQDDAVGAVAAYRHALASDPRTPEIYLHLGHALRASARPEAARQAYLAAWRLQPGLPAAVAELAGAGMAEDELHALAAESWSAVTPGRSQPLTLPSGLSRSEQSIWSLLAANLAERDRP